jgi:hypothetical protein
MQTQVSAPVDQPLPVQMSTGTAFTIPDIGSNGVVILGLVAIVGLLGLFALLGTNKCRN